MCHRREALRRTYRNTDDEVRRAVAEAVSIADALRRLHLVPRGANYEGLRRRIRELGIDTGHLLGQGWRKGSRDPVVRARPLEEVLTVDSPFRTKTLKDRLDCEGYKEARCEECGLTEWNGEPIPLELHHVNGCSTDNRIENLRILCPNCHALTPTYRGKNIGSSRKRPRIPIGRGEPLKKASVWVRSPPGAPLPNARRVEGHWRAEGRN